MKDKKRGGTGGQGKGGHSAQQAIELEKEKTGFEKFEHDMKGTIFNVLYVLLKEEEHSHWKHILEILIDFMQIYYFSFEHAMKFPWKSDEVLHYYQTFLGFFQVPQWLGRLDMTTYLVLFYICIFIVILVILDIFYVSYSFSKKKFAFVWPLQALRSVCGLFVTVLFLPFLETFTTMLHCHTHDGHSVLSLFPKYECWHGAHIIHATFSVVVSSIFIVISLIVSLTYFESKNNSHDTSARVNSRADVFIVIMKIICIYIFAFLPYEQYHWLVIAVLLILSFTAFFNYRNNWPYYNDKMTKFLCVLTGIFAWSNVCLFIAKILEHTEFSGALQLYFLGLPLVVGMIVFDRDERVKLLLKNINNFQKGEEVALQIRYLLQLIHTKDHDRKNAIILKGYIYHHEDSCPNAECQLKQYKNTMIQNHKNKKSKKNGGGIHSHFQNDNNQQLLLDHAKNMYKIGIAKFPTCTSLKIQFSFFLMGNKKKNEAISELVQAAEYNPPFDEQFIIFRYKKMSEDYGDMGGDSHGSSSGGGGMDVIAKFAYESSLRLCQQHIERSAALHLEFWNYLRDDRPDIQKLNETGSKINQSIIMVESYWSQLQKINANNPKALKMYAKFLIEILNDKEGGSELLQRAKDAQNMKQNFYEGQGGGGGGMNEDTSDINTMSANGTPCVYVTGDIDKIGFITQLNASACRLFGFTPGELRGYNVEKLMPEMYAKRHNKVLEDALSKGADYIPNKERIVYGRHKSGYIFPVWLQLKMVQGVNSGVQFVALFKTDKKAISSNTGYILVNKDKKMAGISSSCIKMMNMDIPKMKRYLFNNIDITQMAPELFDLQSNDLAAHSNKGGQILDWYIPSSDKVKSKTKRKQSRDESSKLSGTVTQMNDQTKGGTMNTTATNVKMQFQANLTTITMGGDQNEIGWCLKLEMLEHLKNGNQQIRKEKEKERIRQPLFQFRYDAKNGKFIREVKSNAYIDNASKDPSFINGMIQQVQHLSEEEKAIKEQIEAKAIARVEDVKVEIQEKEEVVHETKDLSVYEQRKRWAKGINIYRLTNGKFQPKDYDEEQKKEAQIEDERRRKHEEEEKSASNQDVFKNSIKSRKTLQLAISDKTTPRAISNLRLSMNIVIVCLLALSITEFVIISSQFTDINENFNLIQQSYGRVSEIQRIAYNVRSMVMINEKKQTVYKNYTTQPDYTEYLKQDIETSLNNLYDLQNAISLSSLEMSDKQNRLTDSKSVSLYFREQDETLKTIKFSLTEAVLQISSAIFTVRHMNLTQFNENQEDVFFITYNAYSDFLSTLRESSKHYLEDLHVRASQKNDMIMTLFLSSVGTLVLTMTFLFPVVRNVNRTRMRVLCLFVDIPNYNVVALASKCEKFIFSIADDEAEQEGASGEDDDDMKIDDSDVTSNPKNKRGHHKQPRNAQGSNTKVFIQFSIAILIVTGYFAAMFGLSLSYISSTKIVADEMNLLAQVESYYAFAQNVQRELINDPEKPIFGEDSFKIAKDSIEQLYWLNMDFLEGHFHNRKIHSTDYKNIIQTMYEKDLCSGEQNIIKLNLVPQKCETFLNSAPQRGLQTVILRYFEGLKETLNLYVSNKEQGKSQWPLLNSNSFQELYIIQFRFIQDTFRKFVETLKNSTNGSYQSIVDTRMGAFIVFVIVIILAYLVLWTPFVNKLNNEIWRTKSMLTIIPIEVILKIPRIQEFLQNQNFFSGKSSSGEKVTSAVSKK